MFLHLGGDVVVSVDALIGIFDLRTAGHAAATRDMLAGRKTRSRVIDIAQGEPKSVILTDDSTYLSPISSLTLQKRAHALARGLLHAAE